MLTKLTRDKCNWSKYSRFCHLLFISSKFILGHISKDMANFCEDYFSLVESFKFLPEFHFKNFESR